MRLENLVGQVFGRLTVKERIDQHKGKVRWKCECTCGGTTKAYSNNLKRGYVTSCGCYRHEFRRGNQLPDGESGFNTLFYDYCRRAGEKGFSFELTKEEFKVLTQGNCFYCGKLPAQLGFPNRTVRIPYIYNGVDRKDSGKGYSIQNCVSCCSTCNYMKSDSSLEDFIRTCKAVAEYQNRDREKP